MKKNLSNKALEIIRKMQQNELTESVIYKKIAKFAKGDENKKTLERLSNEERAHYEIWKSYTGIEMKPEKKKVMKYTFLARVFGFTFAGLGMGPLGVWVAMTVDWVFRAILFAWRYLSGKWLTKYKKIAK